MTNFSRQFSLWPSSATRPSVSIVGCGTLGSYVALALVKGGATSFSLYDPDVVEDVNIPLQLYGREQVGLPKVVALKNLLTLLAPGDLEIQEYQERFPPSHPWKPTRCVICSPDSMAARIEVANFLAPIPGHRLLIDARSGGLNGAVYAFYTSCQECWEAYRKYLYDDSEAANLPCTARGITYSSMAIAAAVAALFRRATMHGLHATEFLVHDVTTTMENPICPLATEKHPTFQDGMKML